MTDGDMTPSQEFNERPKFDRTTCWIQIWAKLCPHLEWTGTCHCSTTESMGTPQLPPTCWLAAPWIVLQIYAGFKSSSEMHPSKPQNKRHIMRPQIKLNCTRNAGRERPTWAAEAKPAIGTQRAAADRDSAADLFNLDTRMDLAFYD
jgi:hypothetical protein